MESRAKKLSKADPNTLFRSHDDWYRNREYFYWQDGRSVADPTNDPELMQWFNNVRYGISTLDREHIKTDGAANPGEQAHGWSVPRWSHRFRELVGVGSITAAQIVFGVLGRKWNPSALRLSSDWGCAWRTEDGLVAELYFDRKISNNEALTRYVAGTLADKQERSTWLHSERVWGFDILPRTTLMNPDTAVIGKTIDKFISDVRTAYDLIAQSNHPNRVTEMLRLQKILETSTTMRRLYEE